ncbi:PKD domain-containing protein, partial [Planococcus sp. APC 4015]|nr:PKD domain-containing protein [Planococcus sp. APC 4015]
MTTAALTLASLAFVAPAATADTAPAVGVEETVTADALPTAQIDGVAWTQTVARNTVWVGGEFTTARPAGAAEGVNTVPRANLMAYNLETGVMTTWNPGANGSIKAITASPDGSRIYVGGTFTSIAGASRNRLAAFDTATGALLPWAPYSNAGITDIATSGDSVYIVGNFSSLAGGVRTRLGAVTSTGALLPLSATVTGGYGITSVVVDPAGAKIVIGGSFESTNGSTNPGRGLAALNAATGSSLPWAVNTLVRNGGTKSAVTSLTSDGDSVYGTAYDFGGTAEDKFEGTFRANWSDGSMVWIEDCHGDNYSVAVNKGVVYTASHDHYCGNIGGFPQTSPSWTFHHSMAFAKEYHGNVLTPDIYGYKSYTGQPAASIVHWYPDWQVGTYTGKSQAAWDVQSAGDYVVYGGEFLKVNNKAQQGLVRFASKNIAPNKSGPEQSGVTFPISAASLRAGEVRLSWTANTDRDNATLTYQVFRQDKGSTPIYTVQQDSNFWTTPRMTFVDRTAVPGQSYQYRVRAIDPFSNAATGSWTSVTAAATNLATDYSLSVLDDGALHYWPMSEDSGASSADWAGATPLTVTGAARGVSGPQNGTSITATQFGGTSSSFASTATDETGLNTFSVESWFKTTSTRGGKIVGFGNRSSGSSTSHDRSIYMDNTGRVTFGVYPGAQRTITSAAGLNNGQWHHVVGTLSSAGMTMYIDGVRVGTRVDTTSAQTYNGFWRIGGDNTGSWANSGTSAYINGAIADVAVYGKALTRAQVDTHWTLSGRTSVLPPAPTDAYGKSVYDLSPTLFWRLGESTGSVAADAGLDAQTGTYFGSANKGTAGALTGVSNTAVSLAPTKSGTSWNQTGITSDKLQTNPTTFAAETWFRTDTTTGGKILGFGNTRTGVSGNYDRHIYMTADGKINFGVYNGSQVVIASPTAFNDNTWHHVVAQLSSTGMQLYIDGKLIGTSPNSAVNAYNGYWRVGGDTGWSGDTYWKGSVDEVAVYPVPLTSAQVLAHFQQGSLGYVNQAPSPVISAITTDLAVAFDASTSSDVDNAIAAYEWNFGDGATATGAVANHTYAAAGTYEVSLKATDALGASTTITQEVTVLSANSLPVAAFTTSADRLTLAVDGSTSTDADGTVATYSWAFGDGAVASGATSSHTYAAAGTYTVVLTVTDDRGGSSTTQQDVTVTIPANQVPTAAFTAQVTNLGAAFNAGSSIDSDGSIVSYGWDFGDGTTGTGVTPSHNYSAAGTFSVVLTVTDDRGGVATSTQTVTTSLAANQLPTASFTNSVTSLTASFDAAASADTDGTIASYAWDFGDGATGSGAQASHAYDAPGAFTVTLTVTDDRGGVATKTADVVVAVTNVLASDAFDRTTVNGWGAADLGGAWAVSPTAARFAVAGGSGTLTLANSTTQQATLSSVSSSSTRLAASFSVDKIANAQYISFIGRQVGSNQYLLRVRIATDGSVILHVMRNGTAIGAGYTVPGLTLTPGATYNVVFDVTGTSPTTLVGKIWQSSGTEPTAWQISRSDSAVGYQSAGSVAISSLVPTSANAYPVKVSIAEVTVTDPAVTATPPNQLPTAAFTSSVNELAASFDAGSSTDSDGTISSYAWNFGDGTSGSGATASRTYTAAGTYTVRLTVTDNRGGSAIITHDVTVAAAPVNQVPVAAFTSSVSGLSASVDGSSSS